jgi:DNA repair exonuclease SbcCD nuclease subunit
LEEILQIAENENVDLALQSGDLYHDLYPSHECICKTLRIFERYVFGQKDHDFKHYCFPGDDPEALNYLSSNKQIKLPIIGIHGNHDYPMRMSRDSAYEMLSITKNINYIGKTDDQGSLVLKPTIFYKKSVAVAVYGIGYIKDIILSSILKSKKYQVVPVPDEINSKYKVMRILLFHQNRCKLEEGKGSAPSYIDYSLLPEGFDLVIWGHEHDCFTSLLQINNPVTNIYQPGSSIATSLTVGESLPKHIGVINLLSDGSFKMVYKPLKTVRPLLVQEEDFIVFKEADLQERPKTDSEIAATVKQHLNKVVSTYIETHRRLGDYNNKLPLVRLNIKIYESDMFNFVDVETALKDKVANSGEIVKLKKLKNPALHQHNLGSSKAFCRKLQQKEEFCIDNPNKADSINTILKKVMQGSPVETKINTTSLMEKFCSVQWKANASLIESWLNTDYLVVKDVVAKSPIQSHSNFGVANFKKFDVKDRNSLKENLRLLADSIGTHNNLALSASVVMKDAWATLKNSNMTVSGNLREPSNRSNTERITDEYIEEGSNFVAVIEGSNGLDLNSEFSKNITGYNDVAEMVKNKETRGTTNSIRSNIESIGEADQETDDLPLVKEIKLGKQVKFSMRPPSNRVDVDRFEEMEEGEEKQVWGGQAATSSGRTLPANPRGGGGRGGRGNNNKKPGGNDTRKQNTSSSAMHQFFSSMRGGSDS